MAEIEESKITDITGGSELDKMDARAKAAVVVVSLGADRASQIYKYLSEQEIEDLTYEVAKLGKTNNAQVENALDEFYKMCLTHKMMTDGGLDYARSVLEKAFFLWRSIIPFLLKPRYTRRGWENCSSVLS